MTRHVPSDARASRRTGTQPSLRELLVQQILTDRFLGSDPCFGTQSVMRRTRRIGTVASNQCRHAFCFQQLALPTRTTTRLLAAVAEVSATSFSSQFDRSFQSSRRLSRCACHRCFFSSSPSSSSSVHSKVRDQQHQQDEDTTKPTVLVETNNTAVTTPFVIPGAQSGGRKLAIVFTCNVCETRCAKQFTERA
jgi:hypothetical protein